MLFSVLVFLLQTIGPNLPGHCIADDEDKVEAVITSSTPGILKEIACQLDRHSVHCDWKRLGHGLGVDEQTCAEFGAPATNSTRLLFNYLEMKKPKMTIGELSTALKSMRQIYTSELLKEFGWKGNHIAICFRAVFSSVYQEAIRSTRIDSHNLHSQNTFLAFIWTVVSYPC